MNARIPPTRQSGIPARRRWIQICCSWARDPFQAIWWHRLLWPSVGNDPSKGLNQALLDQSETWFAEMNRHGIVIFFCDDDAEIWHKVAGNVSFAITRDVAGRWIAKLAARGESSFPAR